MERAVLHRKNALSCRTLNGAQVGDVFMSQIHTCQLCGADSFDYLIESQRHQRRGLGANGDRWPRRGPERPVTKRSRFLLWLSRFLAL